MPTLTSKSRHQLVSRMKRLRQLQAPVLIIKAEQVRLALRRRGIHWSWLNPTSYQEELEGRHLEPLRQE